MTRLVIRWSVVAVALIAFTVGRDAQGWLLSALIVVHGACLGLLVGGRR